MNKQNGINTKKLNIIIIAKKKKKKKKKSSTQPSKWTFITRPVEILNK
jgi:hypothetical protein